MTTLTFPAVLSESVDTELSVGRFYERMLLRTRDPLASKLFSVMAAVQRSHADQVMFEGQKLLNRRVLDGVPTAPELLRVEAGWEDVYDLCYAEALQVVLECEHQAAERYAGLASLFDGTEAALLLRAADVERSFIRQVQGALARLADAKRREHTLALVLGSIVVARRAATATLANLAAWSPVPSVKRIAGQFVAYEQQRTQEIAALSPEPIPPMLRSPAFPSRMLREAASLGVAQVLLWARDLEERTASYCLRGAVTLKGREAQVLRRLAAESLDHAEAITGTLDRLELGVRPATRQSDRPLAA